jgi:hypothetical protein
VAEILSEFERLIKCCGGLVSWILFGNWKTSDQNWSPVLASRQKNILVIFHADDRQLRIFTRFINNSNAIHFRSGVHPHTRSSFTCTCKFFALLKPLNCEFLLKISCACEA